MVNNWFYSVTWFLLRLHIVRFIFSSWPGLCIGSHDDRSSDTFENYSWEWSVRLVVRFVIIHSTGTANLEIIVLETAS